MVPSAMARPVISNNVPSKSSRLAEYSSTAVRPALEDRISSAGLRGGIGNGVKAWGDDSASIWSNFPNSTRESSRTRDTSTGTFGPAKDVIEGKTGSSSLVPSSETEPRWTSPWEPAKPTSQHLRSSGVSPVRRGSSQLNTAQSILDSPQHSSQYYNNTRAANVAPLNGTFDTIGLGPRHSEGTINGYGHFPRSSDESTRPQDTIGSWTDAGSVHSPTDDRRSISNSDYPFGTSSAGASRSGSLPPSRHGNEPMQLPHYSENYHRFTPNAPQSRGHSSSYSSLSNGRYQERQNSQHSDSLPAMFGRMNLESNADQALMLHRNSAGMNGNGAHSSQPEGQVLRRFPDLSNNYEEVGVNGAGSYTPDGYPSAFHNPEPFRFRPSERGALTPGVSELRQAAYYSAGGTPPVYDSIYSSRNDQGQQYNNTHPALLNRKLQRLHEQQQRHSYMQQPPYQPSMMGPYRAQFNNPYAAQYQMPQVPLNGIGAGALMASQMHGVVQPGLFNAEAAIIPRGPRELDSTSQTMQSGQLIEFRASSKGNRRWELKDIYGYVVEFAGDQHGSRFIQQKLETANSDEKQHLFQELLSNVTQLMQDVFGNYVIQKFFEHGDQGQKKLLASKMKGKVVDLSLQMYGCRVVQKALEHVLIDQQASLVKELEPSVLRLVKDQNGNHVIQKAIERVPMEHIQFIIDSFEGKVGDLAIHSYGCRVIQRVLEHCDERAKRFVLAELHAVGSPLISDQYGNYVTQHIIEYGFPEDRARVISTVTANLLAFSKHKFASNVVEQCIVFGTTEQRREIMYTILQKDESEGVSGLAPKTGGESMLYQLVKDSYGNYVVQKLFDELSAADHKIFSNYVGPELVKARRTVSGKQIQAVEKKMHRFDTTDLGPGEMTQATAAAAAAAPAPAPNTASPTPPLTSSNSTPIPQISLPPGPPTPDSLTPQVPPLVALPSIDFASQPSHH